MPIHYSVWILGDQLLKTHPALQAAQEHSDLANIQVVMVESLSRSRRFTYHPHKLMLVFSAMRHYAAWLREQGYQVDYIQAPTMLDGLRQHVSEHRPNGQFKTNTNVFSAKTEGLSPRFYTDLFCVLHKQLITMAERRLIPLKGLSGKYWAGANSCTGSIGATCPPCAMPTPGQPSALYRLSSGMATPI